jgi:hypothetical protein
MEINASKIRYLTKSRFKLAVECPRKLFYTGKSEYLDKSRDDSFLAALAEGGYQVGELAKLMYPGGVTIEELGHQIALEKTQELLKRDQVVIFEAAFVHGNLFIRIDILKKSGNRIELIEVKAKSYRQSEDGDFRGARGGIKSDFLPYLQDVAFQRYVAEQALVGLEINAFLLLANKDAVSSVDGINQQFKVQKTDGRLKILTHTGLTRSQLGDPLLVCVNVDSQVDEILAGSLLVAPNKSVKFVDAVRAFADAYATDAAMPPIPKSKCAGCQFKAESYPGAEEPKSGFHECWGQAYGWGEEDFKAGTVLDLWKFLKKDALIDQGVLKLTTVSSSDIGFNDEEPGVDGLTTKHRQWYTCRADWPGGGDYYLDVESLNRESSSWNYPLHCIDFETCAVAIPFVKGMHPYETTAFQFSHHVIERDGQVQHKTQWISTEPGISPNFEFVRALRDALTNDKGTIFRWAAHENTVLNHIRLQLKRAKQPPHDANELIEFIESVTTRKAEGTDIVGPRSMVDLCRLAEKFYFHPSTKGSNSLKKVLPAVMRSSKYLQDAYSKPWYGPGVSLNFESPIAWWQEKDGLVVDPYKLLPPVFHDIPAEDIEALEEGLSEDLREGGAAMSAYARLQFEDMPDFQRQSIRSALLRYCELDTLAMVMVMQAWGVVPTNQERNA